MEKARQRLAPWRLAALLALVVGVYAAATVTPAAAGTDTAASACDVGIFDGLSGLGSQASAARGDIQREPALNQIVEDLPASAKGKGSKSFKASVPVYFHVVHANGVGNISQSVIDEQMRGSQRRLRRLLRRRGARASRSGSPASPGRTTPSGTSRASTRLPSAR